MPQSRFEKVAKRYASYGFAVFPVWQAVGEACACGKVGSADNHSPAKHPRTYNGLKDATTDPGLIETWGTMYPDANVGIATGPSGLVVLDVDTAKHPEASEAFKALAERVPALKKGWKVQTGSGGWHLFFRSNPEIEVRNSQGKLGVGIDIRGAGGYVVAPPSSHVSGGKYTWYAKAGKTPPIHGGAEAMPTIPLDLIEIIVGIKADKVAMEGGEMIPPGTRHSYFLSYAGALRARGNSEAVMLAAMRAVNAEQCDPPHDDDDLVQIAKDYATKDACEIAQPTRQPNIVIGRKVTKPPKAGVPKITFKPYDEIADEEIEWLWPGRIAYGKLTIIAGLQGKGKCHGLGTAILMADGSRKVVEDVCAGDLVMGDDGTNRTVQGVTRGRGLLFKVTDTTTGEFYTVNEQHRIAVCRGTKYWTESPARLADLTYAICGYRAGVEYPQSDLPVEPYFLGMWLGDGTSVNVSVTNEDPEVAEYLSGYAKRLGLQYRAVPNSTSLCPTHFITGKSRWAATPSLQGLLGGLGVLGDSKQPVGDRCNKHIPNMYLRASTQQRLELLAGLVDADGHLTCGGYEIITKYPRLAESVVELGRSLGFRVTRTVKTVWYKGLRLDYDRLRVCGNITQIPVKIARKKAGPRLQVKDALHHVIKVERIGEGEYAGFEVDGNHLYLLGDYTVTHNSYLTCMLAALISNGDPFPDTLFSLQTKPAKTLMLTYEDGQADTIKVRLRKCGAILSNVLTVTHEEQIFTVDDVPALEAALDEHPEIRVIIIDPIASAMGGTETGTDAKVRGALQPFVKLAAVRKIALIMICHLNKDDEKPIEYRIGGSVAFPAVARSVLLVGHDNLKPYDKEQRISYGGIMAIKDNAGTPTPIAYHISDDGFFFDGADSTIDDYRRLLPERKKREKVA